jgi:integrase
MQYIADFLAGYKGTTMLGYRSAIFQFIDARFGNVRSGKDSTQEEKVKYEQLAKQYLTGEVLPLQDLKEFKEALVKNRRPPHSVSQCVTCVRIWLEHYDHVLSVKELRDLKKVMPRQRHGVTREDEVTPETIRTILAHTGDVRLKAMCLVMLSSGIRIGELIKLPLNDIDLKKRTIYISDEVAKTGVSRITFFTEEAGIVLQQYLNEREKYIKSAEYVTGAAQGKYRRNDTLAFPFHDNSIRKGFISTLKRAGLFRTDGRTKRTTIHPHLFRKFFNSELKMSGAPDDIVEALMGHEGYLASAYRRYSESQLHALYEKYSPALVVGQDDTVKRTVAEMAERLTEQTQIIRQLTTEKEDLRRRMANMEQDNQNQGLNVADLLQRIDYLQSQVDGLSGVKRWMVQEEVRHHEQTGRAYDALEAQREARKK